MAKTYLQVTPVPGMWYVSERFPGRIKAWKIVEPIQPQPMRSTAEMILAGPFDTRDLAVKWNTETSAAGYIWEMELNTPKPPPRK